MHRVQITQKRTKQLNGVVRRGFKLEKNSISKKNKKGKTKRSRRRGLMLFFAKGRMLNASRKKLKTVV